MKPKDKISKCTYIQQVKLCFIFIVGVGVSQIANSQTTPILNCYTLQESDGVSGFNHSQLKFKPNGQYSMTAKNGTLSLNYNRSSKIIDIPNPNINLFFPIKVNSDHSIWALHVDSATLIKNDKRIITFAIPKGIISHIPNKINKAPLILLNQNNQLQIALLTSSGLVVKKTEIQISFNSFSTQTKEERLWFFTEIDNNLNIYEINDDFSLTLKRTIPNTKHLVYFQNENNFISFNGGEKLRNGRFYNTQNPLGKPILVNQNLSGSLQIYLNYDSLGLIKKTTSQFEIVRIDTSLVFKSLGRFETKEGISNIQNNLSNHFFIIPTLNKILLVNRTIKKYPYLFESQSANSIFTLKEDAKGRIWAGSYQGDLAVLDQGKVVLQKKYPFKFMNGGAEVNNTMYFIGEELAGIHAFHESGKATNLNTKITGYYLLSSRDQNQFYYATGGEKGLWKSSQTSIQSGKPNWEIIDSSKGLLLPRALTLTEDFHGNIWMGHPRFGISKYNPKNGKVQNWLLSNQTGTFGAMASLTDDLGNG